MDRIVWRKDQKPDENYTNGNYKIIYVGKGCFFFADTILCKDCAVENNNLCWSDCEMRNISTKFVPKKIL